ncbi:His/Gly/Thr/Pro-type tRNA ligase C-terminal domain-containing protein [Breznakiellaceae bacterium SP9]
MKVSYLDEKGQAQIPTMGSYGIGLDRTLASVIEEHHDQNGIIWPINLAPYQVIIVPIKYAGTAAEAADKLAASLAVLGIDALLDDRDERPGVKFKDADLLGIPYRIVIGDKNLEKADPQVEVKRRTEKESVLVELQHAAQMLYEQIKQEQEE